MNSGAWEPTMHLLQESENCFFYDIRDQRGHGIENVIWSGRGSNKTWWQAESGDGTHVLMCACLGSGPSHSGQPLCLQVLRTSPGWT